MLDAFEHADLVNDSIGDIESGLIANGIKVDDYYVDLSFKLVKAGDPMRSEANYRLFVDQMSSLRDKDGNLAYSVVEVEYGRELCDYPDNSFPHADVLIVGDVDDPIAEITATEQGQHKQCENLEVTSHRIGTMFQYLEWKTVWEVREIRVGRCRIMKTKIPVFYSRQRKEALWCYAMTTEQLKRNFEKSIKGCLESAANQTATLAIVIGGLGLAAAAEAFSRAFFFCFETKVEDAVDCIFKSLKLVAEVGDWEEKVF